VKKRRKKRERGVCERREESERERGERREEEERSGCVREIISGESRRTSWHKNCNKKNTFENERKPPLHSK